MNKDYELQYNLQTKDTTALITKTVKPHDYGLVNSNKDFSKSDAKSNEFRCNPTNNKLKIMLSCPICNIKFDEKKHLPKILPCSQTICLICIRYYADNDYNYLCFSIICKKKHFIPENEFVTNKFVLDLLDLEINQNIDYFVENNSYDKLIDYESSEEDIKAQVIKNKKAEIEEIEDIFQIAAKLTTRIENAYEKYIYDLEESSLYLNNHFNRILNKIDESFEKNINKLTFKRNQFYKQIQTERNSLFFKLKFSEERFNDFEKEYTTIINMITESTLRNELTNELLIRAKIFVDRVNYLSQYVQFIQEMASKSEEFKLTFDPD